MRKFLALTLSLIMIFAFSVSLVSCSEEEGDPIIKPNLNSEYAKEALENAGYNVIYTSGLQASIMDSSATAIISATKGEDEINIIYFSDSSAAASKYVLMAEDHRIEKEIAEKFGKDYNYEIGTSENSSLGVYLVYLGTPEAIKAAR
jgi:hypothetical protein